MSRPRNISTRTDVISAARHDTTRQQFYVVCQIYGKENQCNMTALHKELLLPWVFLSPVRTFVWGAETPSPGPGGGAELLRTMWESEEETTHVVFSLQSPQRLPKRLHLYRPFQTATSSIRLHLLSRPTWPPNTSEMKMFKINTEPFKTQNECAESRSNQFNRRLFLANVRRLNIYFSTFLSFLFPVLPNASRGFAMSLFLY